MSLFLDNLWIWIVLTFFVGVCGYVWYHNDQKKRSLIIAIVSPIFTLALGLTLYYAVDTDRKSIIRMLDALTEAVEMDDLEAVKQFIAPEAEEVRQLAAEGMQLVYISNATYRNLEFAVDHAVSPPTAHIHFAATFYWKNKTPINGFSVTQPILENARFEIELVKTRDRSTNNRLWNYRSWNLTRIISISSQRFSHETI